MDHAATPAVRAHFRQLGREWAEAHPDPRRDAEVTAILRSIALDRRRRAAGRVRESNPQV